MATDLLGSRYPGAMLSSYEVCRLAGITYRQLDYWCRTRRVVPAIEARGSGSARRFTKRQVQEILRPG